MIIGNPFQKSSNIHTLIYATDTYCTPMMCMTPCRAQDLVVHWKRHIEIRTVWPKLHTGSKRTRLHVEQKDHSTNKYFSCLSKAKVAFEISIQATPTSMLKC